MVADVKKKHTLLLLAIISGIVIFAPSVAASCHSGFGCSDGPSHDRGYDSGFGNDFHQGDYRSDYRYDRSGRQNYQRGGLAHDYFHTDQFFGREMRGFPDTAFGEDPRYDAYNARDRSGHRHSGQSYRDYNDRYDSSSYGAFSGLARRYGEGFVSGEGFGDEYIGDPDQLDERIFLWD